MLEGKIAIVTGGSSGIGAAILRGLLSKGAAVANFDVRPPLEPFSGQHDCAYYCVDVTQVGAVRNAVDMVNERFGRIDILINNAGTLGSEGAVDQISFAEIQETISVNLVGSILSSRFAVPYMRSQGGGTIVQIASISGIRGSGSHPVYSAAKGGLIALTKSLASQLGCHNIRVNCVCPGSVGCTGLVARSRGFPLSQQEVAVITRRTSLRNMTTPEDVANAVLFLCTPAASRITGAVLVVDAGEILMP